MDRHPQQIKRERQDKKRNAINSAKHSDMRTAIKRVLETIKISGLGDLYFLIDLKKISKKTLLGSPETIRIGFLFISN